MAERNDTERWIKLAEWRGKTYQALVDINKESEEHKEKLKETQELIKELRKEIQILIDKQEKKIICVKNDVKDLNDKYTNLMIKIALIAGALSTVVSYVSNVVVKYIG